MSDTSKDIQKAITSLKRFVSILKKGQNISSSFYKSLHENPHIPSKIKKQIKQVLQQSGGAPPKSSSTLRFDKYKCGGVGCVYQVSHIDHSVLLKAFDSPHEDDLRKDEKLETLQKIIANIDLFLQNHADYEVNTTFFPYSIPNLDGTTSEEVVTITDPYGYFVRRCKADMDAFVPMMKGVSTRIPELNYDEPSRHALQLIESNIKFLMNINIVHGDIKLANIMYRYAEEDISRSSGDYIVPRVYLHDFDDVFLMEKNVLEPIDDLQILDATFSPLYVAQIYVHYRACVKKITNNNQVKSNIESLFLTTFLDSIKLSTVFGGLVPDNQGLRDSYKEILKQRDNVINFIINYKNNSKKEKNGTPIPIFDAPAIATFFQQYDTKKVDDKFRYQMLLEKYTSIYYWYIRLIQEFKYDKKKFDLVRNSDLYSLGASLIHKSILFKSKNYELLSKLYLNFGLKCFFEYFDFPEKLNLHVNIIDYIQNDVTTNFQRGGLGATATATPHTANLHQGEGLQQSIIERGIDSIYQSAYTKMNKMSNPAALESGYNAFKNVKFSLNVDDYFDKTEEEIQNGTTTVIKDEYYEKQTEKTICR